MRAVTYSSFGPATEVLRLKELPTPDPAPGEVEVTLAYSGVNPSDVKARAGARPGVTEPPFPVICPHSDGAGTISRVGAGVEPARVGQRVWIWNGQWQRAMGTAAEKIVLPAGQAVPLPEGVSLQTGASLGIPGLTAAHVVFGGGSVEGKTLLIHGGNGNVGHLAVQLAAWGGAEVFATARPRAFEKCRKAGAKAVIDYSAPDMAQGLLDATGGRLFDRIIDVEFGQNIGANAELIAPNGTLAVYGSAKEMAPTVPFGPLLFKAVTIDIALIYILPEKQRLDAIAHLHAALEDTALSCPVAQVFGLAQTARAHAAVESGGRRGAILVDLRS
ncbi:MAG: NADPH:quinone reductase [Pseudomonadota bacterium]